MLRNIIRRFLKRERYDNETFIHYLVEKGITIGEGTVFFDPESVTIDMQTPWMIEIGSNVQITKGVTILNHGYDWSVLKGVYGEVLGSRGPVSIGNNCFIGMNTTILKSTHIGNNVIIGANSLVNRDIPDNSVAAGNPCRVIMNLDTYYEKRKKLQFQEASELVRLYKNHYGKNPEKIHLREFFWLFENNVNNLPEYYRDVNRLCGNEVQTNRVFETHNALFNDFDEFLDNIE